jgi:uncharacterized cupredoxin-like copper-binding protein
MKPIFPAAVLSAAIAAFAVAGCGSDSSSTSNSNSSGATTTGTTAQKAPTTPAPGGGGSASSNLQLAADESGELKFDKTSLTAKAGKVTITMDNPAPVDHAIAVAGKSGKTVGMGGKSTVTVSLKPGTYQFYCPVDGHRAAGMKGTLTVK